MFILLSANMFLLELLRFTAKFAIFEIRKERVLRWLGFVFGNNTKLFTIFMTLPADFSFLRSLYEKFFIN